MAATKTKSAGSKTKTSTKSSNKTQSKGESKSKVTKKSSTTKQPTKPRKTRPSSTTSTTKDKPARSTAQLLTHILSDRALKHCTPPAAYTTTKSSSSPEHLYTSSATRLDPFPELLCTAVLSRPLSHRLGQRAIATLLNPPYSFLTAKAVRDAGRDKVWQALEEARTQHRQKTADQVALLADTLLDEFGEGDGEGRTLEGLRKAAGRDPNGEREELMKIKGLGKTGVDIFFRRVQWRWTEVYPFVDRASGKALAELGLPGDAEGLKSAIGEGWGEVKESDTVKQMEKGKGDGGDGEEERKRKAFVVVLERVLASKLEGTLKKLEAGE